MAWTTPRDWATNEILTSANMDTYVSNNLSWMGIDRPHCQVRDGSYAGIQASWGNPSWDVVTTNVGSMAFTSTSYIQAPNTGFYLVGASCVFGADTAQGARALMLSSSSSGAGTVYCQANTTQHSGNESGVVASTMVQLSASALVYAAVYCPNSWASSVTNIRMWAIWMTV